MDDVFICPDPLFGTRTLAQRPKMPEQQVQFHVNLMDKSKTKTVACSAALDSNVWSFGENVGMTTLSTSSKSGGGYVFERGSKQWRSCEHPSLILHQTGACDGDEVTFMGDFEPCVSATGASGSVTLHVNLMDKSKTKTVDCSAALDSNVWSFGENVGMTTLSTSSKSGGGYVFERGSKQWRSCEHPSLTLHQTGACDGDEVTFMGDFEPCVSATGASGSVSLHVNLMDKSKTKTVDCSAALDSNVWSFGENVGMTTLSTSSKSGGGYVFERGSKQWRSCEHPSLTLHQTGACDGDEVTFMGDFEPCVSATGASGSVSLHVNLMDKSKTKTVDCSAALDSNVWSFGENVGMTTLSTSSKSGCGYVFERGSKQWRSCENPSLTLHQTGACDGDEVTFMGDFEPCVSATGASGSVSLHVNLMDKSKTKTVACSAALDSNVWSFGENVGMTTLSTSSKSGGGYVFERGSKQWRSCENPSLTLHQTGACDGDEVTFMGDFEPCVSATGASGSVTLHVNLMDKSKTKTVDCSAALDSNVWSFGENVGMTTLSTSSKSGGGYVFERGSKQWRSCEHPSLTLHQTGACDGDEVTFMGDFEA